MSSILLVPIAPTDSSLLPSLSASIGKIFAQTVEVIQPPLDGSFSFNLSRNQYNSTSILSALLEQSSEFPSNPFGTISSGADLTTKILGITEGDLFVPVLTYVFGEAQLGGRAAVVSSHRLHDEFYGLQPDEDFLETRLLKEAIHELGHTFGLIHCSNYLCVMHSSTGVEEIDVKTEKFCEDCSARLRSAIPTL